VGYHGGKLEDFAPALDAGVRRFAERTTRKVGDDLQERVKGYTPVAKASAAVLASYPGIAAWATARKRTPGTLRESWEQSPVRRIEGAVFRVKVATSDPVAPHVEWNTKPHVILPKHARALTVPTVLGMTFRAGVLHPGTTGKHMMARALADIRVTWAWIAEREWREEARTLLRAPSPGGLRRVA
jgi:hypothetical protein